MSDAVEGRLLAETALGKWLTARGGRVHERLRYQRGPYGMGLHLDGRGVDRGDELVSCPFDLAVTPALARRQLNDRLPPDCSDHIAICSYIALHRSLPDDAACQHREYIDALPADVDTTPPFFTDDEYALLARTNLHGGSLERKANWRREFESIDAALGVDWCVCALVTELTCSGAYGSGRARS